jgi:hypothetical protein
VGRPRLDAVEDVHGAAPGLARGGVGRVPAEHLAMHGPEVDGGHGERRRTSTAGGGARRGGWSGVVGLRGCVVVVGGSGEGGGCVVVVGGSVVVGSHPLGLGRCGWVIFHV